MNIIKQGKTVRITDITNQEIRTLMKCNVNLKVIAYNTEDTPIDFIYLLDRLNSKTILVSKQKDGRAAKAVLYSEAAKLVEDTVKRALGKVEIVVDKDAYYQNKQIIDLIPNIKKEIVDGLISMEYKKNIFICRFDDGTGFIMSLYYWLMTDDFYLFTKEGPIFAYYDPNSPSPHTLEKLLCK